MKLIDIFTFSILLFACSNSLAETLNEKVARNAANCLTGHIATNSAMYQSGEAGKYLLLVKKIVGGKRAIPLIKKSADNLKSSVNIMGGSTKEEGAWLIQTFCPGVDELLNK